MFQEQQWASVFGGRLVSWSRGEMRLGSQQGVRLCRLLYSTEGDEQRCDLFPRTALLAADHRGTRTKFRGPQEPKVIIQERGYGGLDLCRVLEMMRNGKISGYILKVE